MILRIDSFDIAGPRDYTRSLDATRPPKIVRRLNAPATLQVWMVSDETSFLAPVAGARVLLERLNGTKLFSGYLTCAPEAEHNGEGERGSVYCYKLSADGDEASLDRKPTLLRAPFVNRTAGSAIRELLKDVAPPVLRWDDVQDGEVLVSYGSNPQVKCTQQLAEIAALTRSVYRVHDSAVSFAPIGTVVHSLDEADPNFTPGGLRVTEEPEILNDITVTGRVEPRAYVKDYFLGDGYTLRYSLSEQPFVLRNSTLVEEEYEGSGLRAQYWSAADPAGKITVSGGKLHVAGGTGVDGATAVCFIEAMEMGGAVLLQHGDVAFTGASDGVIGGLYSGAAITSNCVAGFRVTKSGAQSKIQPIVNGGATGTSMTTVAGRKYSLTTRFYSSEPLRRRQVFHSSTAPVAEGRGGGAVGTDVRVVLEAREIDPANPATLAASSVVLYDGVVAGAPGFCTYVLVNSTDLHCDIPYTLLRKTAQVLVRSTKSGQAARTRLTGAQADGAECVVGSDAALYFFSPYPPSPNEAIQVSYRSSGRAMARVIDSSDIRARMHQGDDGVRGAVRRILSPGARTGVDCENAALALLDDHTKPAWRGEYSTWSEFLPGGADVFPGDDVNVNAPSRAIQFRATVREVEIEVVDPADDRSKYRIAFANDAASSLACEFDKAMLREPLEIVMSTSGTEALYLDALASAEITAVTSTTVTIDAGLAAPSGGGVEVRRSDSGWDFQNDRNLIGRFTTRTFTVPRLARAQDYWLRQYDASSPAKYSRYSTLLHVDYPL